MSEFSGIARILIWLVVIVIILIVLFFLLDRFVLLDLPLVMNTHMIVSDSADIATVYDSIRPG